VDGILTKLAQSGPRSVRIQDVLKLKVKVKGHDMGAVYLQQVLLAFGSFVHLHSREGSTVRAFWRLGPYARRGRKLVAD